MNRPSTINFALGLAAAIFAGALLLALGKPSRTQVWTDGDSIRTPVEASPIREVLWRPAEPLKGAGFGVADEYEARYSADGTTVVFVRNRSGQNADLFTARWTPAGWSEPTPIDAINTKDNELGPELSRDGQSLYFYSDRPGGMGGYDIWVSHLTSGAWGTPTNLGPSVNSRWNDYGPALSPDGQHLYFSSNRPRPGEAVLNDDAWPATIREHRTRHDYDLYVADLTQGSEARPLLALNTDADEGAPAISPAGDFLYFASDRAGGFGGFDLYRARLTRSGFEAVENLGPNINSLNNDLDPALTSDGFRLMFSSDRAPPTGIDDRLVPGAPQASSTSSTSAADSARYSLWTSTSREVYRETHEGENRVLAWLAAMWPRLLPLALSLGLLYLFYQLLIDPRWRRRFGRLSLLAQCVLISLLIHAGIASLLTIWKVGSGIIDLVHRGGGTRVVLSSGAPSGSIAGQVRGSFTDASASTPTLEPLAVSVRASLPESLPASLPLPELSLPAVTSPAAAIADSHERETAVRPPVPTPEDHAGPAASVPFAAGPAPFTAEPQAAAPSIAAADTARPNVSGLTSGPVQLDVPAMQQGSGSLPLNLTPANPRTHDATQYAGVSSTSPAAPSVPASSAIPHTGAPPVSATEPVLSSAPAPSSVLAPIAPTLASHQIRVAPAVRTGSAAASGPINIAAPTPQSRDATHVASAPIQPAPSPATGGPTLPAAAAPQFISEAAATSAPGPAMVPAAPSAAGTLAASRAELPMPAMPSQIAAQTPLSGSATPPLNSTRSGLYTSSLSSGSAVPRELSSGIDAALPSAAPALAASTREAEVPTPGNVASAVAAPAPLAGALTGSHEPTLIQVTPAERRAASGSGSIAADIRPEVTTPSPDRHASAGGATTRSPLAAAPSAKGLDSQIPVGIPTPLETFSQRAPESRNALVEQMGGSNQTERAVGLALDWFLRHQSQDGHWSAQGFDGDCNQCHGEAEVKADAAMTGMVLLCYLGAGHTHQEEGPYRDAVGKGLQWLIKRQAPDGDLRRGETMYGQTVSAVALCEAFAMTRDAALAEPARKAVEFVLVRAGHPASDKDTSVIGWLVFTVESARRAGFTVPQATFVAARQWLDSVSTPSVPGAYAYSKAGSPSAAMTAEAMFVEQLLGHERNEPLMQQSARYILATPPRWQEGAPTYYWYYATLALFQHQGEPWKQWNDRLVAELLAHQQQKGPAAGSWDTTDEWSRLGGRVYQTAVCTLSLEVYYRYRAK
jgi:hypothetical protein